MKVRRVDFSPDEWLGGTVQLDNAERGLYITACALIYSAGGAITKEHLRAACRDHGGAFNRQLTRLVDLGKLSLNDGQIANKRALNELENSAKRSETSRQNVGKRWNNKGLVDEVVLPDGNANHQPSTINHQKDKPLRGSSRAVARDTAEQMLSIWREECGDALGSPTKASDSRITKCSARLRNELEGDLENWRSVCRRIRRSAFLTEKWKATIDWALEPKNLLKVLEGNYDDQRGLNAVEVHDRPEGPPPPLSERELEYLRTGILQ